MAYVTLVNSFLLPLNTSQFQELMVEITTKNIRFRKIAFHLFII